MTWDVQDKIISVRNVINVLQKRTKMNTKKKNIKKSNVSNAVSLHVITHLKVIIWAVVKNHKPVNFAIKKSAFMTSKSILKRVEVKQKNALIVEHMWKMQNKEITKLMDYVKSLLNKKENKPK